MSVVLFRVDDRLVHGQVIASWGRVLSPSRIVVISDTVAQSSWERDLYETAIPEGVVFEVWSVAEAGVKFGSCEAAGEKVFILVEDLRTVTRLLENGLPLGELNLGGIHYEEGREELLPYLYLSTEDKERLLWLRERGVRVLAQDVPSAGAVDVFDLLGDEEGSKE
jgi:mannose/fructose/N-acetylgalactosamine-specific phosphotransferase system component IIB